MGFLTGIFGSCIKKAPKTHAIHVLVGDSCGKRKPIIGINYIGEPMEIIAPALQFTHVTKQPVNTSRWLAIWYCTDDWDGLASGKYPVWNPNGFDIKKYATMNQEALLDTGDHYDKRFEMDTMPGVQKYYEANCRGIS